MARKKTKITVLCEDTAQYDFIRKYLITRGFDENNINSYPNPKGKVKNNNAKVIEYFPKLVASYRQIKNNQDIAIIVMIDADNTSIDRRIRELNIALDEQKGKLNQDLRDPNEKIAIFVPTRNIETWFAYIENREDNSEEIDYKKDKYKQYQGWTPKEKKKLPRDSAESLAIEICPQGLDENAPHSLHHACEEFQRLQPD